MVAERFRLRLVIRRHGLPEARVVFVVPLENDPTISQLVEQVNEVIPLESDDWGLEDYVVELRDTDGNGFDCLHFQRVRDVLKEDEEVFIRPLVTGDRKKRILSGRHQISNDGKHLFDGVPFGRAPLKTPRGRPPVDIPPLKRRRITYEQSDDEDREDSPLLLMEHGEEDDDEDYDAREQPQYEERNEESEDDLEDADANHSELEDELRDLQMENAQLGDGSFEAQQPAKVTFASPSKSSVAYVADISDLDKIAALRAAFPTASFIKCEKTLLKKHGNQKKAFGKLSKKHEPRMTLEEMMAHGQSLHGAHQQRKDQQQQYRQQQKSAENVDVENADDDMDAEEDDNENGDDDSEAESNVDPIVKHYDQHGFPAGSILAGTAAIHMAEQLRKSGQDVKLPVHTKFDSSPVATRQEPKLLPVQSVDEDSDEEEDSDFAQEESAEEDEDEDMSDGNDGSASGSDSEALQSGEEESDDESSDEIEADNMDGVNQDASGSESGEAASSDEHDSDEDSDSDSGPEEISAREPPSGIAAGATGTIGDLLAKPAVWQELSDALRASNAKNRSNAREASPDSESDDDGGANAGESDGDDNSDDDSDSDLPLAQKKSPQALKRKHESSSASESEEDSSDDSDLELEQETKAGLRKKVTAGTKRKSVEMSPNSSDGEDDSSSDSDDDAEEDSEDDSEDASSEEDTDDEDDGSGSGSSSGGGGGGTSASEAPDSASSSDESSSANSSDTPLAHKSKTLSGKAASKAAGASPTTSRTQAPATGASQRDASAPASADGDSTVAPGKGLTKTQRRNLRRRLAMKSKQAAAKGAAGLEAADGSELVAIKKAALLESLGLAPQAEAEGEGAAHDAGALPDVGDTTIQRRTTLDVDASHRMIVGSLGFKDPKTAEDVEKIRSAINEKTPTGNPALSVEKIDKTDELPTPAAADEAIDWREKINYSGVECCHEGIELSEPPFPFVQRWDPQQQTSWMSGNGNRRKRKKKQKQNQNADADYYEDEAERGAKKRRLTGEEMQEDYGDYDDYDESFVVGDNRDRTRDRDVILNYDEEEEGDTGYHDEPMADAPGEEHGENGSQDDLPPLPSDLSSLPILGAGEAEKGMVLTWKQLLLTKATNWQPQVSDITGVVIEILDGGDLRLLLAKRDRHLDHNEKVYDEDGNRVYDNFELPGMDEEEEEGFEHGYRTLAFADMIEPRILFQPPLEAGEKQGEPKVADDASKASSGDQSTTLDHESRHEADAPEVLEQANVGTQSSIPTTGKPQTSQVSPQADMSSITEDRRHEISLLINDAGFRKDLDPLLNDDPIPKITHENDNDDRADDLSSPSRQLDEEMSIHAAASSPVKAAPVPEPEIAQAPSSQQLPVQAASPSPPSSPTRNSSSQQLPSQPIPSSPPRSSVPPSSSQQLPTRLPRSSPHPSSQLFDSQPLVLEPFNGFSDDATEDPRSETNRVEYPRLTDALPSDTGSARSGRQPDPDYSIELGNDDCIEETQFEAEGESTALLETTEVESSAPPEAAIEDASRTLKQEMLQTPTKQKHLNSLKSPGAVSMSSVTSFPSPSDCWVTASTNNEEGTPAKEAVMAAIRARKSSVKPHVQEEYEAAMRKIDEGDEDSDAGEGQAVKDHGSNPSDLLVHDDEDVSEEDVAVSIKIKKEKWLESQSTSRSQSRSQETKSSSFVAAKRLVDKPIEKPVPRKTSTASIKMKMEPRDSPAPPSWGSSIRAPSARPGSRQSTSFSLPKGSQVIDLISSDAEPEPVEDYADDSVDETFEPDAEDGGEEDPDSVPSSVGWKSKKNSKGLSSLMASSPNVTLRAKRGVSMPLSARASSLSLNSRPARGGTAVAASSDASDSDDGFAPPKKTLLSSSSQPQQSLSSQSQGSGAAGIKRYAGLGKKQAATASRQLPPPSSAPVSSRAGKVSVSLGASSSRNARTPYGKALSAKSAKSRVKF